MNLKNRLDKAEAAAVGVANCPTCGQIIRDAPSSPALDAETRRKTRELLEEYVQAFGGDREQARAALLEDAPALECYLD